MTATQFPASALFVGRDSELAEITRLLSNRACRLLTLVGPGGIGKTRLATEAAQQVAPQQSRRFVSLQSLTTPDYIVPAIADAISLQFHPAGEPEQQLLDYLRDKSWLLVLDNFEHLLDSTPLLSRILAYAPGVRLIITSRERLNLIEEWVLEVGGLAYPPYEDTGNLERYSAVELFVHHARRVKVSFVLDDVRKSSVVRICRLLEGMPLGIELAAAWVRALPCDQIAKEIEHSLDILETPARNVEPRHRNMRVAFEPTWARLSDMERSVFMKLSVFHAGVTREAAEVVAGASLRLLSGLVDKSLLRVDSNGRYSLHELLRQYAEEQLKACGESETTHDAHCAYYAGLLARLITDLKGPNQIRALDEIEAELANVRMSWRWAVTRGKEHEIRQSCDGLHRYYQMRGRHLEGAEAFQMAVDRFSHVENELLAQLLFALAWFIDYVGYMKRALEYLKKGITLLRYLGSYSAAGMCLRELMFFVDDFGGYAAILNIYQDSLTAAKQTDDQWAAAWALQCMGELALTVGKYPEAQVFYQQSLMSFRALSDRWGSSWQISGLGLVAQGLENYEEARQYHQEHLVLCKEAGDIIGIAFALGQLSVVSRMLGELEISKRYFGEGLKLALQVGLPWISGKALYYTACDLMDAQGQPERAVELFTVILNYDFVEYSASRPQYNLLSDIHHRLDTLKAELPPEVFATASRRGEANNLAAIVAILKQLVAMDEQKVAGSLHEKSHVSLDDYPLTDRELEVLRLVANGLSNREIADQLVLATSTIKWYINEIFSKLEVTSRTQAVARAKALGLLT